MKLVKATGKTYKKIMKMEYASLHELIFVLHGFDPWKSTARTFPEGSTKYGFGKSYEFALEQIKKGIDSGELKSALVNRSLG